MATTQSKEQLAEEKEKKLIAEIEKKHCKTVAQLREEREKRVEDAIELRVPDRVPVTVQTGVFAAHYAGLPASALYYDHAAYRAACKKMLLDIEPDNGSMGGTSGLAMEILGTKQYKWPGGTLPADSTYQFVEGEYMKAEEYDLFLADPADFIFRYYLPRTYGALEPLVNLPEFSHLLTEKDLSAVIGMLFRPEFRVLVAVLTKLDKPEFKGVLEKIDKASQEAQKVGRESGAFGAEMGRLGFPGGGGGGAPAGGSGSGASFAPFDTISDRLRGMRGTMLDMYRLPEKLLTACQKLLEWEMAAVTPAKLDARGYPPKSGMPLHRGSDGFMSIKDFEKFYWPTLKKVIQIKIDLGYIVTPFWEGIWDDRLEYLLDFPKGKVVFHCEKTDVFKAKEVLKDHMCIQGGVPPTLLQAGSTQDVEEHCKKLIKIVGKGGGFVMTAGSNIDYAKPANIKAMVDTAKKYGWY
ncbi:MAG: hypothetical protein HYX80_06885 [Chloroflexi bacterium]|nr:hypothetical protein [Chloroflexota bacterium]